MIEFRFRVADKTLRMSSVKAQPNAHHPTDS